MVTRIEHESGFEDQAVLARKYNKTNPDKIDALIVSKAIDTYGVRVVYNGSD